MNDRKRKWEEWKRKEIADAPTRIRKRWRKFIDSLPMPTLEEERKMRKEYIFFLAFFFDFWWAGHRIMCRARSLKGPVVSLRRLHDLRD